jgi:hypothetical protein
LLYRLFGEPPGRRAELEGIERQTPFRHPRPINGHVIGCDAPTGITHHRVEKSFRSSFDLVGSPTIGEFHAPGLYDIAAADRPALGREPVHDILRLALKGLVPMQNAASLEHRIETDGAEPQFSSFFTPLWTKIVSTNRQILRGARL